MTDRAAVPPGAAIIDRIGWEGDGPIGKAGGCFTATLSFPNGPPNLKAVVVWHKIPVRLVLCSEEAQPFKKAEEAYEAANAALARARGDTP